MNVFVERPWSPPPPYETVLDGESAPPGMLGTSEMSLLYHLARYVFRGDGAILDCGTYCGCSTTCLAKGLLANTKMHGNWKVQAYDRFVADEQYLTDCLKEQFDVDVGINGSFEHVFREAIRPIGHVVDVHAGDFLTAPIPEGPIELMHVDVAKTVQLNGHIIANYFPLLIPGQSLVAHQDYYWYTLPYIAITMEYLHRYFDELEQQVWGTRLYRLREPIPDDKLRRAASFDFTLGQQQLLLEQAYDRTETEAGRALLDLISFFFTITRLKADLPTAGQFFETVIRKHEACEHPQYEHVRDNIANRFGWMISKT